MEFSQTSAGGTKVDDITSTANIGFQAADNISLTTVDSTDSANNPIKVLKFSISSNIFYFPFISASFASASSFV